MGKLKWYKRYPDNWFSGTRRLSLEERGAYADIIELIMMHDGHLVDDDRVVSAMLVCHQRTWKTLKARLIDAGKISIIDGLIVNSRCSKELNAGLRQLRKRVEAGLKSGEVRNNLNELEGTHVHEKSATEENRLEENISKKDSIGTTYLTPSEADGDANGGISHGPPINGANEINDAVTAYNDMATRANLPICQKLTQERKTKLKARLSEIGGIKIWCSIIGKIETIPGLLGENDRGWRASFDFLLQPGKALKISEGCYDGWRNGNGNERLTEQQKWREQLIENAIHGPFGSMAIHSNGSCAISEQRKHDSPEREGVPLLPGTRRPH